MRLAHRLERREGGQAHVGSDWLHNAEIDCENW